MPHCSPEKFPDSTSDLPVDLVDDDPKAHCAIFDLIGKGELTDEQIEELAKNATSYRELAEKLGLRHR